MGSGREAGVCEEFASGTGFRSKAAGPSSSWFQRVQSRRCGEPEEQRNTSPEDRFSTQGTTCQSCSSQGCASQGIYDNSGFCGRNGSQGSTFAAAGSTGTTIASAASPARGSDSQDATKGFEKLRGIGIAEGLPAEDNAICGSFASEERGSSNHSYVRSSP